MHIGETQGIQNRPQNIEFKLQSEQAATLKQHGVEVAFDGMQIEL